MIKQQQQRKQQKFYNLPSEQRKKINKTEEENFSLATQIIFTQLPPKPILSSSKFSFCHTHTHPTRTFANTRSNTSSNFCYKTKKNIETDSVFVCDLFN